MLFKVPQYTGIYFLRSSPKKQSSRGRHRWSRKDIDNPPLSLKCGLYYDTILLFMLCIPFTFKDKFYCHNGNIYSLAMIDSIDNILKRRESFLDHIPDTDVWKNSNKLFLRNHFKWMDGHIPVETQMHKTYCKVLLLSTKYTYQNNCNIHIHDLTPEWMKCTCIQQHVIP